MRKLKDFLFEYKKEYFKYTQLYETGLYDRENLKRDSNFVNGLGTSGNDWEGDSLNEGKTVKTLTNDDLKKGTTIYNFLKKIDEVNKSGYQSGFTHKNNTVKFYFGGKETILTNEKNLNLSSLNVSVLDGEGELYPDALDALKSLLEFCADNSEKPQLGKLGDKESKWTIRDVPANTISKLEKNGQTIEYSGTYPSIEVTFSEFGNRGFSLTVRQNIKKIKSVDLKEGLVGYFLFKQPEAKPIKDMEALAEFSKSEIFAELSNKDGGYSELPGESQKCRDNIATLLTTHIGNLETQESLRQNINNAIACAAGIRKAFANKSPYYLGEIGEYYISRSDGIMEDIKTKGQRLFGFSEKDKWTPADIFLIHKETIPPSDAKAKIKKLITPSKTDVELDNSTAGSGKTSANNTLSKEESNILELFKPHLAKKDEANSGNSKTTPNAIVGVSLKQESNRAGSATGYFKHKMNQVKPKVKSSDGETEIDAKLINMDTKNKDWLKDPTTELVDQFIEQRKKLHEIILNTADAGVRKVKWKKSATTFDNVDNMESLLEKLDIAAGSTLEEVKIQNRPLRDWLIIKLNGYTRLTDFFGLMKGDPDIFDTWFTDQINYGIGCYDTVNKNPSFLKVIGKNDGTEGDFEWYVNSKMESTNETVFTFTDSLASNLEFKAEGMVLSQSEGDTTVKLDTYNITTYWRTNGTGKVTVIFQIEKIEKKG